MTINAIKRKNIVKYAPLVMLMSAQIGVSGDNATVNLATNALIENFHATVNQIQIANIVFSLVKGALMIFGGMLGLAIGWKNNYVIGSVLLVIGEITTVMAPDMSTICWVSRVICGIGASLLIPAVLGLCVVLYEGKERALAFGSIGAAIGLSVIIMPPLSGYVIDNLGWRFGFIVIAVYFIIQILMSLIIIPKLPKTTGKIKIDYYGTFLAVASMLVLMYGISEISVWGLIRPIDSPFTVFGMSPALLLVTIGLVLLLWLFFYEQKVEKKYNACLIPSSYIRKKQVRSGLMLTGYLYICFGTVGFLTITWLQLVAGYSSTETGVLLVIAASPMIVVSMGIPKVLPDVSPYFVCLTGILLAAAGCICMWLGVDINGINNWMPLGLLSLGAGQGCIASQSSMIITQAVNERDAAQSGGIQASVRNIGQALGVAVIGTVLLFSLNTEFQVKINQLSTELNLQKETDQREIYQFLSDEKFKDALITKVMPEKKAKLMMSVYREARLSAMRCAIGTLLVVVLLHVLSLGGVPRKSFHQK